MIPKGISEELWLQVKQEAMALVEERAADRALLANQKLAKKFAKRMGATTRIKRREHDREWREQQAGRSIIFH